MKISTHTHSHTRIIQYIYIYEKKNLLKATGGVERLERDPNQIIFFFFFFVQSYIKTPETGRSEGTQIILSLRREKKSKFS